MKMISFDDFQDKYIGKIGTPQRDTLEKLVKEAVQHHLLDSFQIAKSIEYSRIHCNVGSWQSCLMVIKPRLSFSYGIFLDFP